MTPSRANGERAKYLTRTLILAGKPQRETVCMLIDNAPSGVEVVIREPITRRGADANSLMWAGPLKDIAEQVWLDGKQYSAEVWHEFFKREYLPDETDPESDGLYRDGYHKWAYMPGGERVCIGSSTQLTVRGFAQYLEQVYAAGANHGVKFGAKDAA